VSVKLCLVCDECGESSPIVGNHPGVSAGELRTDMREIHGWETKKGHDLCRHCSRRKRGL